MRITTRLSTAGEAGFVSMPVMPRPADAYIHDGAIDEAAIRRDLGGSRGVQFSSGDTRATLAFAVELLDRMKSLMNERVADDCGLSLPDGRKSSAERRFDRGKIAFVRVDVGEVADGLRVKVSAEDPRMVAGLAGEFAKTYAQVFADNVLDMSDGLGECGCHVRLVEGDGCAGVFAEARRRLDEAVVMARHAECPDHRRETPAGLMCAPCVFSCELYRDGRCTYKKPGQHRGKEER